MPQTDARHEPPAPDPAPIDPTAEATDVTNPASPEIKPPPDTLSIDTIKAAINSRDDEASKTLASLRAELRVFNSKTKSERAKLQARIKAAVAEQTEARRLAAALKPRAPRKPKATK